MYATPKLLITQINMKIVQLLVFCPALCYSMLAGLDSLCVYAQPFPLCV